MNGHGKTPANRIHEGKLGDHGAVPGRSVVNDAAVKVPNRIYLKAGFTDPVQSTAPLEHFILHSVYLPTVFRRSSRNALPACVFLGRAPSISTSFPPTGLNGRLAFFAPPGGTVEADEIDQVGES